MNTEELTEMFAESQIASEIIESMIGDYKRVAVFAPELGDDNHGAATPESILQQIDDAIVAIQGASDYDISEIQSLINICNKNDLDLPALIVEHMYRNKIEMWNPEEQRIEDLFNAIAEYEKIIGWSEFDLRYLPPLDQLTDISDLGVAQKFAGLVDKISHFPVWAIDSSGNCLVGAGEWRIVPLSEVYAALPGWMSVTITEHQTDGETDYILAYGDGTYQTESVCNTDPNAATRFATVEDAREYIEGSWPQNSDWNGHWISDKIYQIFME